MYPLIMKGSFLYLHRVDFEATLRCMGSGREGKKRSRPTNPAQINSEESKNSPQHDYFLLPRHALINIQLTSNALPQSFYFLRSCIGLGFFFQSSNSRHPLVFSPMLGSSTENQGECEFDKRGHQKKKGKRKPRRRVFQ